MLWVQYLLLNLGVDIPIPMQMYCDNQVAIFIANESCVPWMYQTYWGWLSLHQNSLMKKQIGAWPINAQHLSFLFVSLTILLFFFVSLTPNSSYFKIQLSFIGDEDGDGDKELQALLHLLSPIEILVASADNIEIFIFCWVKMISVDID